MYYTFLVSICSYFRHFEHITITHLIYSMKIKYFLYRYTTISHIFEIYIKLKRDYKL